MIKLTAEEDEWVRNFSQYLYLNVVDNRIITGANGIGERKSI